MPAGTDLIFFNNPADWNLIVDTIRTAQTLPGDRFVPIPSFDLGVEINVDYIAVVASTTEGKPSWFFAGDIAQVYDFAKNAGSSVLGKLQPERTRLAINRLQLVETNRISTDPFRLKYTPPYWFRDCVIRVYEYTGDTLNFVEDTLFDIGNALGIDPNTPGGLIEAQLTVIEELITDKFRELDEKRAAEIQLDDFREAQLDIKVNQIDAGIYTLAEGLAALLPPDQAEALRRVTRDRLQLDLGFL